MMPVSHSTKSPVDPHRIPMELEHTLGGSAGDLVECDTGIRWCGKKGIRQSSILYYRNPSLNFAGSFALGPSHLIISSLSNFGRGGEALDARVGRWGTPTFCRRTSSSLTSLESKCFFFSSLARVYREWKIPPREKRARSILFHEHWWLRLWSLNRN